MRSLPDGMDIPPPRATAAPSHGLAQGYGQSYRSAPAPDPVTRYLVYAACGLGGLLALGLVGWLAVGRGAAPVPVIEADSRPVRVKPDNPGGMQIAGANEGPAGPQTMAPLAETPAPRALRAQLSASAPIVPAGQAPRSASGPTATGPALVAAAVSAPTAAHAVPAAAPPAVIPASLAPASLAPASLAPAAVMLSPAMPSPVTLPPVTPPLVGKVVVQLASLESEALGRAEWERLSKKMPALLGPRQPSVVRAEASGKTVWRVRTGGFTDMAEATAFCVQVKAKGGACSLAF